MKYLHNIIQFLTSRKLILATAESCTAGQVLALLAKVDGAGQCLDVGYVVYSAEAKKKVLDVMQKTIDKYTLTSEEVAREMASGVMHNSKANVVLATTGITGDQPMDGIAPGTVCFAWGFKKHGNLELVSDTKQFDGSRSQVQKQAAKHALLMIQPLYEKLNNKR